MLNAFTCMWSMFLLWLVWVPVGKLKPNPAIWLLPRVIFVWPVKLVSVSVCYLFYQPINEKIKTWTLCFPTKENPNMEKTLFDWPIVLQYDVIVKYWLISRKFLAMKFFHPNVRLTNQKPRAFVSIW